MSDKVFCIGFHKTGTTSLAVALKVLGYRVTGPNGTKDPDIESKVHAMADRLSAQYDAFQDNPWPILYRQMDDKWPNAKFILTRREPDAWIRSQVKDFGLRTTPMRQWIYGAGCPEGNEQRYLARYRQHNDDVLAYFAERPGDLLILDLEDGIDWPDLCAFLGRPVPDTPFPHANKASLSRKIKNWLDHLGK